MRNIVLYTHIHTHARVVIMNMNGLGVIYDLKPLYNLKSLEYVRCCCDGSKFYNSILSHVTFNVHMLNEINGGLCEDLDKDLRFIWLLASAISDFIVHISRV